MMDLLKFICPIKHDCYKNLRTKRHDGTLNRADKEHVIYVVDESIQTNNNNKKKKEEAFLNPYLYNFFHPYSK